MYHEGLVRKPYKYMAKMDDTRHSSTVFHCRSDGNIFGELLGHFQIKNGHFQTQNGHFKAFLNRQEGNEEYSKMDETHVTSTVYHCHSDDNTFRELLGHFEIQNGHF